MNTVEYKKKCKVWKGRVNKYEKMKDKNVRWAKEGKSERKSIIGGKENMMLNVLFGRENVEFERSYGWE